MIVLRGIRFESHCEHHMAPIIGRAWVAYIPNGRVVGISKLARSSRLRQAPADPGEDDGADRQRHQQRAAATGRRRVLKAEHLCMTARGIMNPARNW